MPKIDVWFAIPSASPEKCRKVLPIWKKMGYKTAILQNFQRGDIPADLCVWYDYYPGWPGSVNILCRDIVPKDCRIVVSGGDDMLPDPNHTAQELAEQFLERFPDTFGVMQPHGDEFLAAKRYCGSPFLGRAFFDNMYGGRGAMYDGYHHNYADNELYWVARGLGALWERPDLSHYHDHFTRDGKAQPAYWNSVKQNDMQDCFLYFARVHQAFSGHEPLDTAATRGRNFDRNMSKQEMLVLANQRLLGYAVNNPVTVAIMQGLERCKTDGHESVALYGFGLHTQAGAAALREPPVRIDCIIDDNEANHGRKAWNIPIVSREQALSRGIQAVVLSGNSVEDRLWENSALFREQGVAVYRLYGKDAASRAEQAAGV